MSVWTDSIRYSDPSLVVQPIGPTNINIQCDLQGDLQTFLKNNFDLFHLNVMENFKFLLLIIYMFNYISKYILLYKI